MSIAAEPQTAVDGLTQAKRFRAAGKPQQALEAIEVFLQGEPEHLEGLCVRSLSKCDLGRVDEAVDELYDAMFIDGEDPGVLGALADCMRARAEPDTAICYYDQALDGSPDDAALKWRRALCLLTDNQIQQGMAALADGWVQMFTERGGVLADMPSWTGGPVEDKRVLIHPDPYIGNTLQFLRFVRDLKAAGATACMAPSPDLELLVADLGVEFSTQADLQVSLMAIPGLLGLSESDLGSEPYLRAEVKGLISGEGRHIGISWRGSPEEPADTFKAPPLSEFGPIAGLEGISLWRMQPQGDPEELEAAGFAPKAPPVDLRAKEAPLAAIASMVQELDAVVTADTELAHLAGALGVRALLVLPASCSWRWMYWREDSPWYPSVTLVRQNVAGEWSPVFKKVAELLQS
ncbi:MAG: hypothetical protein VX899_01360 [Myxococcota bacterium]|nr:hypothetical protein [Myxococcota bacterium]